MSEGQILEVMIRGAAVGGFVGLALAIGRDGRSPARVTGVLFCLAAASHTLTQLPQLAGALGVAWAPIWALSVAGAGLFWAFAMELFEDKPKLDVRAFIPAFVLLAVGIGATSSPVGLARPLWLAHNLISAALMGHVLFLIWSGWRNDLVEQRRRLRGPVLAAGAAYALVITLVESGEVYGGSAAALSPLAAALLFVMSMAGVGAFLRAEPELFGPCRKLTAALLPEQPALAGADAVLAATLDRLMREDRIYREEGLTISALALKLKAPEHHLRRLINQRLGHRNFTAFLNQWRLGEVKQALSDPSQREVPISTIALDAGFQSLGPFNRAFKAETGVTPSEYRSRAGPVAQP